MALFGRGDRAASHSSAIRHQQRRLSREADLSTEQARAQAPSWVPCTYGDRWRAQGRGRPPGAGPQAAERLTRRIRGLMERLKQRASFLAAAGGLRAATAAF